MPICRSQRLPLQPLAFDASSLWGPQLPVQVQPLLFLDSVSDHFFALLFCLGANLISNLVSIRRIMVGHVRATPRPAAHVLTCTPVACHTQQAHIHARATRTHMQNPNTCTHKRIDASTCPCLGRAWTPADITLSEAIIQLERANPVDQKKRGGGHTAV